MTGTATLLPIGNDLWPKASEVCRALDIASRGVKPPMRPVQQQKTEQNHCC
jgi:hypothetical protein